MIRVSLEDYDLCVEADHGDLAPRDESQLAYWGLAFDKGRGCFTGRVGHEDGILGKIVQYISELNVPSCIGAEVESILSKQSEASLLLKDAMRLGSSFKQGAFADCMKTHFVEFLKKRIRRKLKDHQVKAALHLLHVKNGANFSVPGSGKTTVALSVFEYLREQGQLDSLFVVGPPACFEPWITEYEEVLGNRPRCEILAGGDVEDRRDKYLVTKETACDLYLTTFQTLQRDCDYVRSLFNLHGIQFLLIFDEAHYIKQIDGAWANAALFIAPKSKMRCVLTGTPFPRDYTDAFNIFDVLWPYVSPISQSQKTKIELLTQKKRLAEAAEILDEAIGPLFYRVRKQDLRLAPQTLHPPIKLQMKQLERYIYDAILDRVQFLNQEDYLRNIETVARLKRGRLMRLRQSLSHASLLRTAIDDYDEDFLGDNMSLSDVIAHYDQLESPAKLEYLLTMVEDFADQSEKVVVWSNFVHTLSVIAESLRSRGCQTGLIYGATPTHISELSDELTRQDIIDQFVSGSIQVLIANPAACAESISLHKTCSHAIYYDLSYNCAQYLQSLDRIHRVGGSEQKAANYYFLQYENTIDADILRNLQNKARAMSALIDQPYSIYSLDMFSDDEELEAYDRLFPAS